MGSLSEEEKKPHDFTSIDINPYRWPSYTTSNTSWKKGTTVRVEVTFENRVARNRKGSWPIHLCNLKMAESGVRLLSRPGDGVAPGYLSGPSPPNSTVSSSPTPQSNRGCENGDLMDTFGIFLQGLLAVVAFSTLMCKYGWCFANR